MLQKRTSNEKNSALPDLLLVIVFEIYMNIFNVILRYLMTGEHWFQME